MGVEVGLAGVGGDGVSVGVGTVVDVGLGAMVNGGESVGKSTGGRVGTDVKVGVGRGAEVNAGAVVGRGVGTCVGGTGVAVTVVPHATTPTITATDAAARIDASSSAISEV